MILRYWCSKWLRNPFYFAAKAIKSTKYVSINKEAIDLVDKQVQEMLRKGAVIVSDPKEDNFGSQFLSLLFLVKKKHEGNHPVVNLKNLNINISYRTSRWKGCSY